MKQGSSIWSEQRKRVKVDKIELIMYDSRVATVLINSIIFHL